MTVPSSAWFRATLLACLVAGTLDIVAAIVLNLQVSAQVVLQSVASGWMGAEAYRGGWPTALLGLASHYGIMLVIAAIWMAFAVRVSSARRLWPLSGALWGVVVWVAMTYGVVPLSASPLPQPDLAGAVEGLLTHILAVGLPMAWIARRMLGR